jgi:hypothetical protein
MDLVLPYKQLVDESNASLKQGVQFEFDLGTLCEHFGVGEDVHSSHEFDRRFKQLALDSLVVSGQDDDISFFQLKKLMAHLMLDYYAGDHSLIRYIGPLDVLLRWLTHVANAVPSFSNHTLWHRVLGLTMDYLIINPKSLDMRTLKLVHCRQYAVAQAARYFRNNGYPVELHDAQPVVSESDLHTIARSIESDIAAIGGERFINVLFKAHQPLYDPDMERFRFAKRFSSVPRTDQCKPSLPVNYLLNLAAKHYTAPPTVTSAAGAEPVVSRIREVSRYFAALYDVQAYNHQELMLQTRHTLQNFMRETALYDSFFVPSQMRPSDIADVLFHLFAFADPDKMRKALGFDLSEYVSVVEQILNLATSVSRSTHFHSRAIKAAVNARDAILNLLAHNPNDVNTHYLLPTDYEKETFNKRPLIRTAENTFVLPNKSWNASAFYEALFMALLKVDEHTSKKVGDSAETYIHKKLKAKGVTFTHGTYTIGNQVFECDVVVETPKYVVFIEIKKKPLTRKARGGHDTALLSDLVSSVFESQLQAMRHRFHLFQQGQLVLTNSHGQSMIELRNRCVLTVTVTTQDYGGFQDTIFAKKLIEHLATHQFEPITSTMSDRALFEKINQKITDFGEMYRALLEVDPREKDAWDNGFGFSYLKFLSLPQLLVTLDGVIDNASLETALIHTQWITSGSQDYYYELSQFRPL